MQHRPSALVWVADGVAAADLAALAALAPRLDLHWRGLAGPLHRADGELVPLDGTITTASAADVLLVPPAAGWRSLLADLGGLLFLHRGRRGFGRALAWDNGILVLAACGLANDRPVAASPELLPGLRHAPRVRPQPALLVDDGWLATATGPGARDRLLARLTTELAG